MKKILVALLLAALMLIPLFTLTSCDSDKTSATEVDSFNGQTAYEAFSAAMQKLEDTTRYDLQTGVDVRAKLLFFSFNPLNAPNVLTASIDGENAAICTHPETLAASGTIGEALVESLGMDADCYYIDGVLYTTTAADGKIKYETDSSPLELPENEGLDDLVEDILTSEAGTVRYFTEGEEQYFTVDITGGDMYFSLGNVEHYTVYISEDGLPERILVEIALEGLFAGAADGSVLLEGLFVYDDLSPVTLPDDADEYKDYES